MKKYLDENGLSYFWSKLKTLFEGKVSKEEGKGLSSNDYTTLEKQKLSGVTAGAQPNVIEQIKVNNTIQNPVEKTVNITIPTNNNQLVNGAGYQTSAQVTSAIKDAVAGITSFKQTIVSELPASGVSGTIYLKSSTSTSTNNIYDEFIYINNKWEEIGTTEIDLTNYLKKTDITEITNADIDLIIV